jgi:hypothetical protein
VPSSVGCVASFKSRSGGVPITARAQSETERHGTSLCWRFADGFGTARSVGGLACLTVSWYHGCPHYSLARFRFVCDLQASPRSSSPTSSCSCILASPSEGRHYWLFTPYYRRLLRIGARKRTARCCSLPMLTKRLGTRHSRAQRCLLPLRLQAVAATSPLLRSKFPRDSATAPTTTRTDRRRSCEQAFCPTPLHLLHRLRLQHRPPPLSGVRQLRQSTALAPSPPCSRRPNSFLHPRAQVASQWELFRLLFQN